MASPQAADLVGRVLGDRYRLLRTLGVGASAQVYVAEDVSLRRRVAVKVLHPALAGDESFLRRFRAEAQVVAALRHPNILRVYDWGEDAGAPYLVTELLEGGSLRGLLDGGTLLSPAQAATVGADAARALDHAHRRGLVHRDVKPANLLFDDEGRVCVADFGLARALAEASWTEPAGAVVGTARYAAPEQVRGRVLDSRADVYALALVLVEATTGRVPFATDTTIGTLMARVDRPLTVGGGLGPLGPVLEAAGTIEPEDRLDAIGLVRALDVVRSGLAAPAPLVLTGPLLTGRPERDDQPTVMAAGRSRLFDMEAEEPPARVVRPVGDRDVTAPTAPAGQAPGHATMPNPVTDDGEAPPPRPHHRRRNLLVALVLAVLVAAGATAVVVATRPAPLRPVPSVHGDDRARATTALAARHLHLRVTGRIYDPTAPTGTVLTQRPARGQLREGAAVDVVLSLGPRPVPVPTLTSRTRTDATTILTTLGLAVGTVTLVSSPTVPENSVITSTPMSGTLLPGGRVDLVVSTGKPTVAVPSLTGSAAASYTGAAAALGALGLPAVEEDEYSDTVAKGAVIATSPVVGTVVRTGDSVTVLVSKGPDLVAVPSTSGDSVGAASEALSAEGFAVSGVSGNPTSTVTGTTPAAGTLAHRGASVQITTG